MRKTLEVVVFLTGAQVMALEITASRVLAPFLGSSTYVWTSIIGVVLASLSIGYYFGGKLADNNANPKTLAKIIFIAGFLVGIVAFSYFFFLSFLSKQIPDLRLASLVGSFILFGPVSICLGMVSPYALRLYLEDIESSGSDAGRIFALSTAGSILGTFLSGFYLISIIGTTNILFLAALVLMLTSFLLSVGSYWKIRSVALIFTLCTMMLSGIINHHLEEKGLVDIDTDYSRYLIYDSDHEGRKLRSLITNPSMSQSIVYLDNPTELYSKYIQAYLMANHLLPEAEKGLLIGGGAYIFPTHLSQHYPDFNLTVVEIDPELVNLSKKYFFFEESENLELVFEDGRSFLNSSPEKFDIVYLDAFSESGYIPPHLTTVEVSEKIYGMLNEKGVLVTNLVAALEGDASLFFQSLFQTYKSVFDEVFVLRIRTEKLPEESGNLVIVALKNMEMPSSFVDPKIEELRTRLIANPDLQEARVLTDDFAPVEYLMLETMKQLDQKRTRKKRS